MQSKESADLLIAPRWLLPIAPVNTSLGDHGVVITGGRIVAVGPVADLDARFEPRERVFRTAHALLPGFVNAHTRASMSLFRGLPVYAPLMRWLRETVSPAELRSVSPDFVRVGTQLAIAEMLRAGITSFCDSYLFPDEVARTASAARVRAVIGLPVSETASAWAESATAHFARAERLWDEYKTSPWISLYFAAPPSYAIGDALLGRLRSVADELDARIAMPVHETELEVRDALSHHGRRPLHRLAHLGLLRPGFTAVNMNRLDATDLELTRETGISVVACPQSNLRLGNGSCPVSQLIERAVNVGLGSDYPVSAGAFDLLAEARLAALLAGGQRDGVASESGDSNGDGALSSSEALGMATLGGAVALGLGGVCGSIEAGKAADLVCVDLATLACQPGTQVADTVLFAATRQQVSDVWVAGRAAVSEGHLLAFDEQELIHLAQDWARRIQLEVAA
ncbi:MAG TPA: amidohydrolase family protein [Steroidobacteraceae bacterium]|nr:amidohydrolase family protein [Steroidobacteraceae bacterium]